MTDPTPERIGTYVEIDVMQKLCTALKPLDHEARVRVMAATLCMYDQAMAERVMRWWRDSR